MRFALISVATLLLAGCGSSPSASPTVVPSPTATMQFKHAPPMTINRNHHYTAILQTSDGTISIALLPKIAPLAVNNFVFLARHHYYDGVIYHRIIRTFMEQTGDPTGTGFGGPGYSFKIEPVPPSMHYKPGIVAMANTGQPNTNGSQFFIITANGPNVKNLPRNYTIFGKVTSGMGTVNKIANTPVQPSTTSPNEYSQPINAPVVKRLTIHESA